MFKAVFSNNKYIISKLVESILDYYKIKIDIKGKELIIKNNEIPVDNYQDKQLICDYIIKLDDNTEVNIEINRSKYIGVTERNLTYSFKIYYDHFKSGDTYNNFNKYTFLQVNFNNYCNPNGKNINKFYMIDIDDLKNRLSNSFSIMNIDIASCYKLVYNNDNLEGISDLEIFSSILYCEYLEDIASILERGLKSMDKKEKEKLLKEIKEKARDKNVLEAIKLENTMEDRFKMIEDLALETGLQQGLQQGIEQGIKQGIEQNTIEIIKILLERKMSYQDISEIAKKSIAEIKKIEKEYKN